MRYCIVLIILLCTSVTAFTQDGTNILSLPEKTRTKFLNSVSDKFNSLEKKIARKTHKTLTKLQKQEYKIYKKLNKKDSVAAKEFLANSQATYSRLESKLNDTATSTKRLKEYIPAFDTLKTSLSFLNKGIDANSPLVGQLGNAQNSLKEFESRMQVANEIKKQLKDRKKQLSEQLEKFGLTKQIKGFNKEVYYYQEQLNEYKSLLKDPKKAEQKALALLRNSNAFKDFMKKNSILSQLFKLPENYGSPASLAGLQTRESVEAMLSQRFAGAGANPQQYIQQQASRAQAELNKLKAKLKKIGGGSSSDIDAEGFKPNTQKTKSFLNRLEYGTNFQTQKVNSYFPVTTDIALSVGYKLNDKSVVGIGASYKLGLGSGIEHIKLTHEGVGLRSYLDYKIKSSFWISGGYEQNYLQRFSDFSSSSAINLWRRSALLGITKKTNIGKKKTSKVQLLYDFFYQKDNIRTQPLVFRIGYTF